MFQEDKLKSYYNDLHWALNEYDRVVSMVIPVTAMVLRPHFNDMEAELRPGALAASCGAFDATRLVSLSSLGPFGPRRGRRGGSERQHS